MFRFAKSLSVILPGFNEKASIRETVTRYCIALSHICEDYEIIIVNDASTDGMGAEAENIAFENPKVKVIHNTANLGQAASILIGFAKARGQVLTHNAMDLPFAPEDTTEALALVAQGADVVVVQRSNRQAYNIVRKIISHTNIVLNRILFGTHFMDHNFVQFYVRHVLQTIEVQSKGVSTVTLELILRSIGAGFTVVGMWSIYHQRRIGISTVTATKIGHAFCQTIALFWLLRGHAEQSVSPVIEGSKNDGAL